MNLNITIIVGRTTEKPALKSTQSGQGVTSFGVATNKVWTDKAGQKQENVEFHRVIVWGKQAETVAQWVEKGQLVAIVGRLQTRKWKDKQGMDRYSTEVVADRVQFGPKPQGKTAPKAEPDINEPLPEQDIGPGDLPF